MTVGVHRIFDAAFREAALTGEGASLFGGRWNSTGTPVVYAADSIALALLERLVHAEDREVLRECQLVTLTLGAEQIVDFDRTMLPKNWKSYAPPKELQDFGDDWILRKQSLALRVPSIIVEEEYNFLINPEHPEFQNIEISPIKELHFDERLWKERQERKPK